VLFCDSHQPPPDRPAELPVMEQLHRTTANQRANGLGGAHKLGRTLARWRR
jgi:hypothetical protein